MVGDFSGNEDNGSSYVKKEIDGIKHEIASTIYCAAMIYELSEKDDEDSVDFYRDCNMLSTALSRIYAIRFREVLDNHVDEIMEKNTVICSYRDIVKVSDTMLAVSNTNSSNMTTAMMVMRCCGHLSLAIASRLRMIGLTNE